uniref:C2H2-type domain-containing protein n=1 Tax=Glossina brevipalpis TaxID=37001 RepID=A0A1A9W212_9MUSC
MPPGLNSDSSDLESVFSLKSQTSVIKPRRSSGTGLKYYCNIAGCQQSFKRLDHLDRHEYKHTGIKKHACHYDECQKSYSILTHLKRHIRNTHERLSKEPLKNVACEVDTCNKFFTSLTNMHRHMREVHENPKVYQCSHCEEKFTQKLKMRRHEISKHTGIYPYNCDKCSKGFYQKYQAEKHEEFCKSYLCPTCNVKFDKWSLYLKHCKEKQHGRKYYQCEYCPRIYAKPGELQAHVACKHLLVDGLNKVGGNFKCSHDGCERSYSYERNLKQHMLTAHQGKRFECEYAECKKVFSSAQNLKKHLAAGHVEKKVKKLSVKSKRRKDAGLTKIANLTKLSGLIVNKELNEQLRNRNIDAIEIVTETLSQEAENASEVSQNLSDEINNTGNQ